MKRAMTKMINDRDKIVILSNYVIHFTYSIIVLYAKLAPI